MNFAVIFSGQGLQSAQHLQEINDHAQQLECPSPAIELMQQLQQPNSVADALFENQNAQAFIFTLQYLRWMQIQAHLPEPVLLAGYSLGEVSAYCCSASLSFSEAFDLVRYRAHVMSLQNHTASGLLSVQGLNNQQLDALLNNTATEISIKQNESSYIVGGSLLAIEALIPTLKQHGALFKKLNVNIASHTSFMHGAAQQFADYCQQLQPSSMQFPIISASHALKYSNATQALATLSHRIDHSLDWSKCMDAIGEYQPDVILEVGPGNALTKMLNQHMPDVHARSIDDFSHFNGVIQWLSRFS